MHLRAKSEEPETLKVHREMYERRLREMELNGELSKKEVDAASSPEVLEHRDPERSESSPTKKAAYSMNQV